jgi:hypothetical protein
VIRRGRSPDCGCEGVVTPAGTRLATVMNVCSNSGVWTQRTFNLSPYAGQTVVLWFNVHDDTCPSDPSYMLVDDISIQ